MANEFKVKKGLVVDGTNTVLDIQGTQGQLFSVTDSLTGDLFSVSDISGIPILNVNSSGLVTIDGTVNSSGDITIDKDSGKLILQDTGTGNALNQWISYRDSAGTERAYLGYGSTNDSTFYIVNNLSDLKLYAGGVLNETKSGNTSAFAGKVYVNQGSDLTTQALQVNGFIDITDVAGTALRWYNGTTFKGGLGLDDWAHSGSSNDTTMYIAGNNSFFVSTNNVKRLEINTNGSTFSHDLTFGSTGGNGAGRLIIRNDTSGNQGTAGLGVLKQRDVNRQVISGQSTHIGGYIWYTIKIPSGYSNSGLGSDVEVVIRTGGKHHNGKTLQKYIINVGNGISASIGNFTGINILQTLDSRIGSGYGGSGTEAEFYYRTSVANDTGEVILRLYRADREPVTVVEINPQGAWNETDSKTPSLVCHGLGTTFDSGTGKGQINETRPTSNLSAALVIQKASFEQTTGTNGKFTVSANGPSSGNPHEIARFINVGSSAVGSHMYIGASSGTDWRLGKNVLGTAGNSNFEIAPHSGTTKYLEINAGTGLISANSGVYTPQYVQANQALIKSNNSHAVFGSNSASVPLGFARDSNHATYPDMTISSVGNMSVGGVTQYSGTGVRSINIVASSYPVLAFYATSNNTLYSSIFSYYNKTGFFHSASNATWEFNNGAVRAVISGSGTITAAADVIAYGSPSDKRLKENIKPIESALDKVVKLQGVTFDWKKSDSILDIKEDIGFIAQDVKEVIPELVRENEDGMLSMRHQGIAPILLEAIKELKQEIDELKKQIK